DPRGVIARVLTRGKLAPALHHERVLEELDLVVVLPDPGQIDDDLDRAPRLVGVGVGAPAALHEDAQPLALPEVAELRHPAPLHDHRVAITQAPAAHAHASA